MACPTRAPSFPGITHSGVQDRLTLHNTPRVVPLGNCDLPVPQKHRYGAYRRSSMKGLCDFLRQRWYWTIPVDGRGRKSPELGGGIQKFNSHSGICRVTPVHSCHLAK
jgi:hypothetical protein